MANDIWYEHFLEILYKKYPNKAQLTQALMDLLSIEREAVYRRLRQDVMFPFNEIIKIASAWNVSIDEIIGVKSGYVSFHMRSINYLDPSEEEVSFLQYVIQTINNLKDFPEADFMEVCNRLPRPLFAGFKYLNQFYIFKWMYQYGNEKNIAPFSQTIISEKKLQITDDYYRAVKNIPNTSFMWDHMLFDYLARDIRYFHSVMLITDEEKELIKQDLYALLDYMSEVARKGCYPETQNKVNLYISQLNIDTYYSYTYTQEVKVCFIHVFDKYEIYTFDSEMATNFKAWMQLKKRTSVQISEVDERSRIEYFVKQRQIIDNL